MIDFATDLPAALALAKQSKKHTLAMFCRSACTECDKEYQVMSSPQLQPYILQNFVPFRYLVPYPTVPAGDLYWQYCKGMFGSFPAFVVLDSQTGSPLVRWNGLMGFTILSRYLQGLLVKFPLPT
jgi:hypothetical protein